MAEDAALSRSKPGRGVRPDDRTRVAQHYWAFLSYSHKDAETADWLHEALEQYRVPPALVGKLTDNGPVPRKLTPIFRDRHELAAAGDLSAEIEEALAGSRFLIVLCSPAAAQSRWTNQEIIGFKQRHPEACVLAAIVDGEPFASEMPGREAEECFPEALRIHYDRSGRPTGRRAEPMAADFREHRDGRKLGLLKIVAGMLGLGLDDLVQRDSHRRQRRLALVTGGSVLGMLASVALAVTAIQARDSARDQRREAEGLIGFMLGDLRQKLEPLGRLDVLDAVGGRALEYYEKQDKEDLSDLALAQRSQALTLMGEMANAKGDLDGALARYREALEGTAEAVRRVPDDPQNLFNHAQNIFWVGYIDYQRGNFGQATAAFREYRALADRMIALAPGNADYRLERIYADSALGAVQMDQRRYREAAANYQIQLEQVEQLIAANPAKVDYQHSLSNILAWLADARERNGQLDEAMAHRERQLRLLAQQWAANPGDSGVKRNELAARRSLSRLLATRGQMSEAFEQASLNTGVLAFLIRTEPSNTEWAQTAAGVTLEQAELQLAAGRTAEARQAQAAGCAAAQRLIQRDRTVEMWRVELQRQCATIAAQIALRSGDVAAAVTQARQLVVLARAERDATNRAMSTAKANLMLGTALRASGQQDAARGALQVAAAAWPKNIEEGPQELALKAMLLALVGRDSTSVRSRLAAMGYRHPDYQPRQTGGEKRWK